MRHRSIEYWTQRSRLGQLLVAGTERGVCFVHLDDTRTAVCARLKAEFPYGAFRRCEAGRVRRWCEAVARYLDGRSETLDVPIDVRGSCFQRRVWTALQQIPRGETRSYSELAAAVGQPGACRAVARACAANPVPVAIPCHRVVEKGGGLGGYALGTERKRALLEREGAAVDGARPSTGSAIVADPPSRRYTAAPSRSRSAGLPDRVSRPSP